jgi:hypothetical protein
VQCEPVGAHTAADEVADQLEEAWLAYGAFANEAHSITVENDLVALASRDIREHWPTRHSPGYRLAATRTFAPPRGELGRFR